MWTLRFWKAVAERSIGTAAQSALAVVVVDQYVDAFAVDYKHVAGVALGGAFACVLKCLAAYGWNDLSGPSLGTEQLRKQA
jgi:hypothetical protein